MDHNKVTIICGFPGIGKTTAAVMGPEIYDVESSIYHWREGELNPDWPDNYIRDLINYPRRAQEPTFLLASCHRDVRKALDAQGVKYVVVAPKQEMKNEYLVRYLKRGDGAAFIKEIEAHWDEWIADITHSFAPVIWLGEGVYLSDILPKWR